MYCDLHTHSIFSDGTDTPEELIAQAERRNLTAIALTDHNTVAGLPRFLAAAEGKRVRAVPGIEFSTGYGNGELHILGLFLRRQHYDAIRARVALPDHWKRESNLELAQALNRAGYLIDYAELENATPGGKVNRAHFAKALAEKGYVKTRDQAFQTILQPGGPFYHPPKRLDVFETIAFLRSLGAVALLAHPFFNLDKPALEAFLPPAMEAGLDGMEVRYSTFDPETTALAIRMARQYGLVLSGGSDYHGGNKPDIQLMVGKGDLAVPEEYYGALASLAGSRQG